MYSNWIHAGSLAAELWSQAKYTPHVSNAEANTICTNLQR